MATLEYNAVDIRLSDKSIYFDVSRGLDESIEARGTDQIVPDAPGRVPRGRQPDRRVIELVGYVQGLGATLVDQQEDYRVNADTILAVFNPAADPADLVLTGPYLGVPSGTTWTISCRVTNIIVGPLVAARFRTFNVELEAVSATDWTVAP